MAMAQEIKQHRRRLSDLIDQLKKHPDEATRAQIGEEICPDQGAHRGADAEDGPAGQEHQRRALERPGPGPAHQEQEPPRRPRRRPEAPQRGQARRGPQAPGADGHPARPDARQLAEAAEGLRRPEVPGARRPDDALLRRPPAGQAPAAAPPRRLGEAQADLPEGPGAQAQGQARRPGEEALRRGRRRPGAAPGHPPGGLRRTLRPLRRRPQGQRRRPAQGRGDAAEGPGLPGGAGHGREGAPAVPQPPGLALGAGDGDARAPRGSEASRGPRRRGEASAPTPPTTRPRTSATSSTSSSPIPGASSTARTRSGWRG